MFMKTEFTFSRLMSYYVIYTDIGNLFEKGVFVLNNFIPISDMPYIPEPNSKFPSATPLGMAYVPFQTWGSVYDDKTAFIQGTVFPDLDFPFCGEEVCDYGNKQ